jgi:nucleotide-binding universal stress UspA family protein
MERTRDRPDEKGQGPQERALDMQPARVVAVMIVMGSQGRGRIPETFVGSVSHQVVQLANVPVLLVPALAPAP